MIDAATIAFINALFGIADRFLRLKGALGYAGLGALAGSFLGQWAGAVVSAVAFDQTRANQVIGAVVGSSLTWALVTYLQNRRLVTVKPPIRSVSIDHNGIHWTWEERYGTRGLVGTPVVVAQCPIHHVRLLYWDATTDEVKPSNASDRLGNGFGAMYCPEGGEKFTPNAKTWISAKDMAEPLLERALKELTDGR